MPKLTQACVYHLIAVMWLVSRSCQSKARMVGKTVVITGADSGIGKETARDLYRRGARVVLACLDISNAEVAAEELKGVPPSRPNREQFVGGPGVIAVCKLDLASLSSIRECARHIFATEPAVHVLINNAGVMMFRRSLTVDGFETQLGINHLGHFLFTLLLMPKIIESREDCGNPCRIVNVSSFAHEQGDINFADLMTEKSYNPLTAYNQSKLANVLFTRELARRLKESGISGVNTYSLHPGVINTGLYRHLDDSLFRGARFLFRSLGPSMKTVEQGAQTTLHCAVDEEAGKQTGLYYRECMVHTPSCAARDDTKAARLWDESIKLVGLPTNNLSELIQWTSN